MTPNIRQNFKSAGKFRLKGTNQTAYGYLKIHNGHMYLSLIGRLFYSPKTHQQVLSSNDGCVIGRIDVGYKVIIKNFGIINWGIPSSDIASCTYCIYSLNFYNLNCSDLKLVGCNQVLVNMDNLSHYLYTSKLCKNNRKLNLGTIKFRGINYQFDSILSTNSCKDLSKFQEFKQSWINISIRSKDNEWNCYKNIIPLATIINKFVRLMTRLSIDITNILEFDDRDQDESVYIHSTNITKHRKYNSGTHFLSYRNISGSFKQIFHNFLNIVINNMHTKSLINAILLVNLETQNILDNNLTNCTNAIEAYYGGKNSLRSELIRLVKSIPVNIRKLILKNISIDQFTYDIKDTRVHIVHGKVPGKNGKGHILKGVDLSVGCSMLRWIIYTRILLDIGVPKRNVYMEVGRYIKGTNKKGDYIVNNY